MTFKTLIFTNSRLLPKWVSKLPSVIQKIKTDAKNEKDESSESFNRSKLKFDSKFIEQSSKKKNLNVSYLNPIDFGRRSRKISYNSV
jgi:hypothetical protein